MCKAGPTSPSVLKSFTHFDVVFLQLHFKHHSNSLLNAILAELWDGTVAGLTSQRRKFSAYRIVKGDSKMELLSSTRSCMPSLTAWLPMQEKFTSLLHASHLGYPRDQKISEDSISLARLIQCPDPTGLVLQNKRKVLARNLNNIACL